ncbi:AsmA-like C-terminal domain-containing protein [Prosthecodimorpha hirschii]|uniref:AsmA-like C-terminal domain-containing protein n=1 Tax=Prosthecodimorpha hirschii TaxID=665126 RepID=UPI0015E48EF4|nr:AsmA-like C-terminal domain-containing protein [Prosthecomicrobium hirschii]
MLRICFGTGALVVLVLVLAFGAFAVRLASGPLEVATIARIAEGVVSDALGSGRKTVIGKAELAGSFSAGLSIRLQDVTVGEPGTGLTAVVPRAEIRLQSLPILLGQFKPVSLDLDDAQVVFDLPALDRERQSRPPDLEETFVPAPGQPKPGVAAVEGTTTVAPRADRQVVGASLLLTRLEAFGRALTRNLTLVRAQGLESITTRRGSIVLIRADGDGKTRKVVIPDVEATSLFRTAEGDIDLGFSARGEVGRWSMRLRHLTAADGASHSLEFGARDVTVKDLFGAGDPDLKVEMPIYPHARVDYDAADRLLGARLDLRIGAGLFRFGKEPEDEIVVDEGQVGVSWARGKDSIAIETASLQVGPTLIALKGSVTPPVPGKSERWETAISLDRGQVAPRDVSGKPVELKAVTLVGGYETGRQVFHVDDLQIHFAGGAARAVGHLDFAQPKPLVVVNVVFTTVEAATVAKLWPHFAATGARDWFINNVKSGRLHDAIAQLQIPLLVDPPLWPPEAVRLSARFDATQSKTFGDLPDLIGAEGRIAMEKKRFEVTIDKSSVLTRHPRRPTVVSFKLDIPDAVRKSPRASMEMRVAGDNLALGEIIEAEPLALLSGAGIKLDGLAGTGDVRGRVDLTFHKPFDPASLDYKFEGTLDKFGSPSPILGRRFSEGALKVAVDRRGTTITGKAKIEGVPTDVNMFEPSESSSAQERRDFAMTLDDAARARMGLDLAGMVAGPLKIEIGQPGANEQVKRIIADMTGARLFVPQFGWTKGAGVPARASLDLVDDERGGTRVDNFSIESEGLQVKGSMTVDKDKRLATADFQRFALRRGDDARIRLQRGADQALAVNFEAGSFDLRSLLASLKKQGEPNEVDPKKLSDLIVKARAARLVGFNDVALTDVLIDAQIRNQTVIRLQMTARAPGGRSVEISIRPDGNRRVLTVNSDDAGAVLGFLDVYERLRGGSLRLSAVLSGPGSADGVVKIVGFGLLPPKNERVASLRTTNDGLREVAVRDVPVTEDASFDRFQVNFAMRKGVITVSDGIAKGQATGATMSGQIDLVNQRLNVAGTFIPLYGLNNLVSRIPLFGEIVGAGRNEGLVGVTFKVVGSVDNPVLQFNPISAIAPGIFRRIFEYRVDDGRVELPPER